MGMRDSFTDDEWDRVLQAPLLAGFAVTAADPSGLVGTVRETAAMGGAIIEAKGEEGSLVAEVVAAYKTEDGRMAAQEKVQALIKGHDRAQASGLAVSALGATAALVETKLPAEAPAFRGWLREIARRVSEASSEGGFLGFGGEKVSDDEKRTLADIDAALDAPEG